MRRRRFNIAGNFESSWPQRTTTDISMFSSKPDYQEIYLLEPDQSSFPQRTLVVVAGLDRNIRPTWVELHHFGPQVTFGQYRHC